MANRTEAVASARELGLLSEARSALDTTTGRPRELSTAVFHLRVMSDEDPLPSVEDESANVRGRRDGPGHLQECARQGVHAGTPHGDGARAPRRPLLPRGGSNGGSLVVSSSGRVALVQPARLQLRHRVPWRAWAPPARARASLPALHRRGGSHWHPGMRARPRSPGGARATDQADRDVCEKAASRNGGPLFERETSPNKASVGGRR